jgi:hypothetical protein
MGTDVTKIMEYAKSKKADIESETETLGAKLLSALKGDDADAVESAISDIVDSCMEDYE